MELTAYILCPETIQSQLYGWLDDLSMPVQLVSAPYRRWQIPEDAGILITHRHYRWDELAVLRRAIAEANVPVLVLADGILEYRNTWENPKIPAGVMFQPLMGHKLACLGRAQARWVESWGNPGCAEVIGLPRLDRVQPGEARPLSETCRILVATARTPAFDDAQRGRVVAALSAVRDHAPTKVHGRSVEFVWRLSAGLDTELGLTPNSDHSNPRPLAELIGDVDAVITTPSTLFLESLKSDRPTALLDFHRCPHYVPAAWTISSADQVADVVAELALPPEPKMEFQRFTLHDQLECQTAATPRMVALVSQMVELGVQARAQGKPLQFPHRLVPLSAGRWSSDLDPAVAFPDHPAFADRDVAQLQVELSAALSRLETLFDTNDQLRQRVRELHDRVTSLRARFGIEPRDSTSTTQSEDAPSP